MNAVTSDLRLLRLPCLSFLYLCSFSSISRRVLCQLAYFAGVCPARCLSHPGGVPFNHEIHHGATFSSAGEVGKWGLECVFTHRPHATMDDYELDYDVQEIRLLDHVFKVTTMSNEALPLEMLMQLQTRRCVANLLLPSRVFCNQARVYGMYKAGRLRTPTTTLLRHRCGGSI